MDAVHYFLTVCLWLQLQRASRNRGIVVVILPGHQTILLAIVWRDEGLLRRGRFWIIFHRKCNHYYVSTGVLWAVWRCPAEASARQIVLLAIFLRHEGLVRRGLFYDHLSSKMHPPPRGAILVSGVLQAVLRGLLFGDKKASLRPGASL